MHLVIILSEVAETPVSKIYLVVQPGLKVLELPSEMEYSYYKASETIIIT